MPEELKPHNINSQGKKHWKHKKIGKVAKVYPMKQYNTPNGKGNKKWMGKTVFEGAFETWDEFKNTIT